MLSVISKMWTVWAGYLIFLIVLGFLTALGIVFKIRYYTSLVQFAKKILKIDK